MKRTAILWMLCSTLTFGLQAQVKTNTTNNVNNNAAPVQLSISNLSGEALETYLAVHFPYMQAVSDLNVQHEYKVNLSLTRFVYNHIRGFYKAVEDGIAAQQLSTDNEVKSLYQHFLDTTAAILQSQSFIDKPIGGTPPAKMLNGPCVNMDFEDGTTNGWDLYDGDVDGSVPYSYINNTVVGPGASHLIVSAGVDPVCGFPMVNPAGGAYSCRLGDGVGTGAKAAKMTQTFMVTPANSIFSYSYAVVLQDPGHTVQEQPYFTVRVYDQFGNNVNCGSYSVIAGPGATGFQTAPGGVMYKNWTTVFSQLTAYIGQNVTIEFTVGDCSRGGHYGYAYIDASCQTSTITTSTGDTVMCQGDMLTLFAPVGGASYLWNTGDTTSSINVTTAGYYSVQIIPVQGALCAINMDINVVVFPKPVANFTAIPSQVCLGDTIAFDDGSSVAAPSALQSWEWNFGDGISTPLSSGAITGVPQTNGTYTMANHLYTSTGIYNVQLIVVADNHQCADTVMHTIQVNALPSLSIIGDTVVCFGEQTTLTASGANTYTWDHGITNGVAFTPPLGTTVYTVIGTNASGCEQTMQISVTANPLPSVGYTASDTAVCDGTFVTLSGTGASSYTWNNGITNGVPFMQAVGTTSYTVVGTNAFGCTDSAKVSVSVHPNPSVSFNVSDSEVCEGTSVTLSGTGASVYTWNNGVSDGVAFTPPVGITSYEVIGTNAFGCTDSAQVSITVHALPNVFAQGDTVCAGQVVTLNGQNAISYTWDHGVSDGVPFNPPLGTTIYTVTGTDAFGCKNNYSVTVLVNGLPHVFAGNDISICAGTSALLTASGASTYTWNNGVTNGVAFNPVATMSYTVVGTDANGCTGSDSTTITVIPIPTVDFIADRYSGCAPFTPVFTNQSTGNLVDCNWSFSNGKNLIGCGNVSATFDKAGCYDVTLTVSTPEGCTNTLTKTDFVCVVNTPVADFYTDPTELTTEDTKAGMVNSSIDATHYRWTFGDGSAASTDFEPQHTFPDSETKTYVISLVATNDLGCKDSTTRTITVKDELIYYVPNTFTPDGDSHNQIFKPIFATGYDPYNYTLYIFNRWGDLLFESHNTDVGWDGTFGGKVVEDGVYVWKIIVKYSDSDGKDMKVGHVSLLR